MKAISAILLLSVSFIFAGCESELPPSAADEHAGDKLKRGLTGQGNLVVPDRSSDPLIGEQTRVGN